MASITINNIKSNYSTNVEIHGTNEAFKLRIKVYRTIKQICTREMDNYRIPIKTTENK